MVIDAPGLTRSLTLRPVVLFGLAYLAPMIVLGTFGVLAETTHGSAPTDTCWPWSRCCSPR